MIRVLRAVGAFWREFLIGEDGKIAAAVGIVLALGAVGVLAGAAGSPLFAPLLAVCLAGGFLIAFRIDLRRR